MWGRSVSVGSRRALGTAAVVCLVAGAIALGCSKEEKALGEVRDAYEAGEYKEAIALSRYAIRRNVAGARVYFYYGASLLSLGRDHEAIQQFEKATWKQPDLVAEVGALLFARGEDAFKDGRRPQATRRMRKASEFDTSIDLREYAFLVGDSYFEDAEWEWAAQFYRRALATHPDTAVAESAGFKLAQALMQDGRNEDARQVLERYLEAYPKGEFATDAKWRLVNLLYEEGEKHLLLGNYEEVVELVTALVERTDNPGMVQKSRFLLGEAYEALGEFDSAYRQYKGIIEEDRGASGRIVERAREKLTAFREAGLN